MYLQRFGLVVCRVRAVQTTQAAMCHSMTQITCCARVKLAIFVYAMLTYQFRIKLLQQSGPSHVACYLLLFHPLGLISMCFLFNSPPMGVPACGFIPWPMPSLVWSSLICFFCLATHDCKALQNQGCTPIIMYLERVSFERLCFWVHTPFVF